MFKIYVYLLKHNPEGVTLMQIAKDLNMSFQLTHYHIQKLVKLGYVKGQHPNKKVPREEWGYKIKKLAPIEPLKQYLFIANRFLIPRQAIYVTVFFILLCLSWLSPNPQLIQAIAIIPLLYNLYELLKRQKEL